MHVKISSLFDLEWKNWSVKNTQVYFWWKDYTSNTHWTSADHTGLFIFLLLLLLRVPRVFSPGNPLSSSVFGLWPASRLFPCLCPGLLLRLLQGPPFGEHTSPHIIPPVLQQKMRQNASVRPRYISYSLTSHLPYLLPSSSFFLLGQQLYIHVSAVSQNLLDLCFRAKLT